MGLFGGIVGRLFGTDEAVKSVIDHTSNAIDKLVYTSEEKADDATKSITEARGMLIEWIKNTQGQNLSRRVLALSLSAIWIGQYILAGSLSTIAVWLNSGYSAKCLESAKVISEQADSLNGAMMLILTFYFAAPHIGSVIGIAMDKFGSPKSR